MMTLTLIQAYGFFNSWSPAVFSLTLALDSALWRFELVGIANPAEFVIAAPTSIASVYYADPDLVINYNGIFQVSGTVGVLTPATVAGLTNWFTGAGQAPSAPRISEWEPLVLGLPGVMAIDKVWFPQNTPIV